MTKKGNEFIATVLKASSNQNTETKNNFTRVEIILPDRNNILLHTKDRNLTKSEIRKAGKYLEEYIQQPEMKFGKRTVMKVVLLSTINSSGDKKSFFAKLKEVYKNHKKYIKQYNIAA